MGIKGIEHLTGGTMQDEQQNQGQDQPTPGAPVEQAPDQAPQGTDANDNPPQSGETQDPSSSADGQDTDDAPDADEPGDTELAEELQEQVHTGDVPPDGVDQEG